MRKFVVVFVCLLLVVLLPTTLMADTKPFSFSRERHDNDIEWSTECKKSYDGERRFYVTITAVDALNPADTIYFGSRRVTGKNQASGALSNGLAYTTARDPRQSLSYFSDAYIPGGSNYVLNIKQSTDGPGALAMMDARWTP